MTKVIDSLIVSWNSVLFNLADEEWNVKMPWHSLGNFWYRRIIYETRGEAGEKDAYRKDDRKGGAGHLSASLPREVSHHVTGIAIPNYATFFFFFFHPVISPADIFSRFTRQSNVSFLTHLSFRMPSSAATAFPTFCVLFSARCATTSCDLVTKDVLPFLLIHFVSDCVALLYSPLYFRTGKWTSARMFSILITGECSLVFFTHFRSIFTSDSSRNFSTPD